MHASDSISNLGSAGDPLEILLEDGPLIAVNKPAGLLTQGVPVGVPSLEFQVKDYLKHRYGKPGNVYLGIPHRLDRPVSGVVVFARNSKAARRLAEQFQNRQVQKKYWAIVENRPDPMAGFLRDWIRKLPDEARSEIAEPDSPNSRECALSYRTITQFAQCTLVEIELLTGRMHQIRVQFASRGWPVIGDALYGAVTSVSGKPPTGARDEPIMLHAYTLTLLHPVRYETIAVTAPVPSTWRKFLE